MLKVEGKYAGSLLHKHENMNEQLTWNTNSAIFYGICWIISQYVAEMYGKDDKLGR